MVRLGGVGVDVGARPALEGRDQVGADALRHEAGGQRGGRVGRPGAAVGAHRHPAHRLDAAGEDQVLEAGADASRRLVDGLQAAGAEAVELDAGDRLGEAGRQRRGLGDVAALLAERRDDAEHDVVDAAGVEPRVARLELVEQPDDEVDGLHLVQRADGLALAARRPEVVVHECFGPCSRHSSDCDTLAVMVVQEEAVEGVTLPGPWLTLDELTQRVGMSVRNVRFYTSRGLVPPPVRRGRSGYYSADHVARLELVQELQSHGFTLAAIEKYVAGIPASSDAGGHRPAPDDAGAVADRAAGRAVPGGARQAGRPQPERR